MSKQDEGIDLSNFSIEEELAKFKGLKATGWEVIVRLYTAPQMKNGLIMPDSVHDDQQYRGCVGLVVAISPDAYKDSRYAGMAPWCKVGQWHLFPRHSGVRYVYDGLPIFALKEDGIGAQVDDPSKVTK